MPTIPNPHSPNGVIYISVGHSPTNYGNVATALRNKEHKSTMNEAETRTEYILPALKQAGWGVVDGSRIREEFPISIGRLIGYGEHLTN